MLLVAILNHRYWIHAAWVLWQQNTTPLLSSLLQTCSTIKKNPWPWASDLKRHKITASAAQTWRQPGRQWTATWNQSDLWHWDSKLWSWRWQGHDSTGHHRRSISEWHEPLNASDPWSCRLKCNINNIERYIIAEGVAEELVHVPKS